MVTTLDKAGQSMIDQVPGSVEEQEQENSPDVVSSQALLRGRMVFNDVIEIDLGKRLPQYSNNYVGAYAAKSLGSDGRDLLAFVCEPQYTPRNRQGPAYAGISNPSLLRLIGSGIGRIADTGVSRFVFIYENALGKAITDKNVGFCGAMKSEKVMEKFVLPLIGALKDLRDNDIVHGAIRPTNMFDGGKDNYDHVILGDCLSLPPSMAQPVLLEPVDRAMASPTGRGVGTNQDDLYSLGVSIALLVRTRDPMRAKSDADIIQNKMAYGTYATVLAPEDHLPGAMVELLRGLMMDDRRMRWTLDDVLTWMDGRRLSPKQSPKKLKAARPLPFNSKTYTMPALLARDIFGRVQEAVSLIESGELEQWIKRSLDDDLMLIRFESGLRSAEDQGRSASYWDRLVSRIGLCLDPEGPIRYKTLSLTGEGVATALAEAFVTKKDLPVYAEVFNGSLLSYWMATLTDLNHDMANFVTRFDACRNYIKQPGPGLGLERILYFLNADVHCLSPIIERYYVRTPEEFLLAAEQIASMSPDMRPQKLLDRHSMAFLCVKDRKVCEPFLFDLGANESYKYTLGTLQTLASIQRYYRIPMLKNLTQWMADFIEPVFSRFHDAEVRRELRRKVAEVRDKGDLGKLLSVLDNAELLRNDLLNFRRAMREYRGLVAEQNDLAVRLKDARYYGRREGRETSVVLSGMIATLLIVGVIILYLNGARIL